MTEESIWKLRAARLAINLDRAVCEIIDLIIVLLLAFTASGLMDTLDFVMRGRDSVKLCDFTELGKINPDIAAWLIIDGTHINHPVVQGDDDFRYLDVDFYGDHYAGGTLFLPSRNSRDLSDSYDLIHGHHMTGGAMFGDLKKFLDRDFFSRHTEGKLLTPHGNYRLRIFGAGTCDAYDSGIYEPGAGKKAHKRAIVRAADIMRGSFPEEKLLVLSTCSGSMDDSRTVVFCAMKEDPSLDPYIEENSRDG